MAKIRHELQQDLFQPNGERLLAVVHVEKKYKKKKPSFLCLVSTAETPVTISIVQVKGSEKNFKRKHTWSLPTLKSVDGKNENEAYEFDLHLDRIYQWVASNLQERRNFIITLWKHCHKNLVKQKPVFKNVPKSWINEEVFTPEIETVTASVVDSIETVEEYQPITEKEENDLTKLISGCEFAISNAQAFMEVISRDLSLLDGENVQCVLASEAQVEALMEHLESAIQEADRVEKRLDVYFEILQHVRDTMETIEKKNSMIEVANRNNQLLLEELENIVNQLDLKHEHQVALVDTELNTPQGLAAAVAAGNALRAAMNSQLHPALLRLTAVQEQRKRFEKLKEKFSYSICRQLNNLFIHFGNDKGEGASDGLILPQHETVHKELAVYTELMHWMKSMDRKAYGELRKVYTDSLGKLYERDLKLFFEKARERVLGNEEPTKQQKTVVLLGVDREQWPPETDRQLCDTTLEQVLVQLEPVCLNEQQFCVSFFQLDVVSPMNKNTQTTLDGNNGDDQTVSTKRITRQINEEVRRMMAELFSCLEEELLSFISYLERQDSFYCMYVLVRLSQHVMLAQDTGSFLSVTFATALVKVKRSFDKFMQTQLESIQQARLPRRSKCGILPYVLNFEIFARNTEALFGTERRTDLDKWYVQIVNTMINSISAQSAQHHKTPQEVVKMENYHHLYALLSQLKIPVLDNQRKDAKQKYNEALAAYVTQYFGRPLDKLNQFFDGVEAKVASGVKVTEISYQLAFSKQELRKVIQQYPGREVKRGLESLYRKVEKHLSEEENLLQVVWRAMQEEFIRQYKHLEDLIQRCYPGSMITLDFSINDILEFFSEIALSH